MTMHFHYPAIAEVLSALGEWHQQLSKQRETSRANLPPLSHINPEMTPPNTTGSSYTLYNRKRSASAEADLTGEQHLT